MAVLLLLRVSTAAIASDDLPGAVVIYLDGADVRVEAIESDRFSTPDGEETLVVWAQGDVDRWQTFKGTWVKPSEGVDSDDVHRFELASLSRGQHHAPVSPQLAQQTTLLTQLRVNPLTRGTGSILVPYQGAVLLNPQLTFRREAAADGEKLGAAEATVFRGKTKILTVPFAAGRNTVSWSRISNLPDSLKTGLPAGSYRLELPSQVGTQRVRFSVAPSEQRKEVERHSENLARLLGSQTHPLVLQVAAEQMLLAEHPHLGDALDVLDRVDEKKLTAHLQALKKHVQQRLLDPSASHRFDANIGEPSGDDAIDEVRTLISSSNWKRAEEQISAIIEVGDTSVLRTGLAWLYRGVILAEAGATQDVHARAAFETALRLLSTEMAKTQLSTANNNYGSFLLARTYDQLHNHAFRMATGVKSPLFRALLDWKKASFCFRNATQESGATTTVGLNQINLDLLLADILETLSSEDVSDGFSLEMAGIIRRSIRGKLDSLLRDESIGHIEKAAASEMLTVLSVRQEDLGNAAEAVEQAMQHNLSAGSLLGVENCSRLMSKLQGASSEQALKNLRVSEAIGKLLRERYPEGEFGLSSVGFFSRRANSVDDMLATLIAQGRNAEALHQADLAKSRALHEMLKQSSVKTPSLKATTVSSPLANWPSNTVGLQYYLGSETAWIFFIDTEGNVSSQVIADESGSPMASRDFVAKIQAFLEYLDGLGPGNQTRQGEGPRIARGGDFDWKWQQTLRDLHQLLIPESATKEMVDGRHLVIVPHHILHYFPFAALVSEIDARNRDPLKMPLPRFLVDDVSSVVTAPSLSIWKDLRSRENRPCESVRAVGISQFGSGVSPLPGVRKEIEQLTTVFGTQLKEVLFNDQVTPESVSRILSNPGLLILATHGMKQPDKPLDGFLVCRNENGGISKLTAAEIYGQSVAADLVVMNACYGGYGDRSPLPGDDLFGVKRALLSSGARTVVSGMWDIYDATAPEIMSNFYGRLIEGSPVPTALAESQKQYLLKHRNSSNERLRFLTHPYYWAVFNVSGDDRTSFETIGIPVDPRSEPPRENRKGPEKTGPKNVREKEVVSAKPAVALTTKHAKTQDGADRTRPEIGAFSAYVDLARTADAVQDLNAAALADSALLLREGERVLHRNCDAVSSKDIFRLAIRVAIITNDAQTVDRLKSVAQRDRDNELRDISSAAAKLLASARTDGVQRPQVTLGSVTETQYRTLSQTLRDVQLAVAIGDDNETQRIEHELSNGHEFVANSRNVKKLLSNSRQFWGGLEDALKLQRPFPLPPRPYSRMSVSIEVLVNGRVVPRRERHGKSYLDVPKLGVDYELRVRNHGSRRIVAIVSVDGLSVMNGRRATANGSGYVIAARGSCTIRGWRTGPDTVAKFSFQPQSESYASRMGQPSKVGVIKLLAIEEYVPQPSRLPTLGNSFSARDTGLGKTGTGFGDGVVSRTRRVSFRRSSNTRTIEFHYDTAPVFKTQTKQSDYAIPPPRR